MHMLDTYLKQRDFDSYEDFHNNFQLILPERFNFAFDVVDRWAAEQPEKRALVYENDFGVTREFTFSEMSRLSNRAANYFLSKGIKRGDVVMLVLSRRYQFWYALLGLHKIGAVCVPATEQLKLKDYEYRFSSADIKMIVSIDNPETMENVEDAQQSTHELIKAFVGSGSRADWDNFDECLERQSEEYLCSDENYACNHDIMLMYFTSGTTGNPKTVAHDYFYPLGHITTAYYWHNCVDNGLHLSVAETGWAKCAWGKIYGQWLCGSAVMVYDMERFDAERLLDIMEKYPITTFCAPPTIFRFLIRCDLSKRSLSHIRDCTTAGEALNAPVYEMWLEKTGLKIREGFGQTESVIIAGTFKWMEPIPGSLGRPNPLFDVRLINERGEFALPGEDGQISIMLNSGHPAGLLREYYNDPEKTRATFADGIYYTGDLAYSDEMGLLWYVGRADDVIKTSGYRVGPFEVESALMKHECVLECAITGVPDEVRGQVIKASIVLNRGFEPSDALKKEIQNFVKSITAPYKYPRVVEFVAELPKTSSGKIRRYAIRRADSAAAD